MRHQERGGRRSRPPRRAFCHPESVSDGTGRFLGQRVRRARARAFVGRERELALAASVLRGEVDASVLLVHGPGGIGKTMLLRQVADRGEQLGRPVVEVDGGTAGRSTSEFEAAAQPAADQARPVLLVDGFEQCRGLETWLRDRFLPRLPADAVVVIAGREPPDLEWSVDPGWSRVVRVIALEPLDRSSSAAVLTSGGLAPHHQETVLRFAAGNPLVLSLAAAVGPPPADGTVRDDATWRPSVEVLRTLVSRLVGEVPSPAHRQALDVTARAFRTDEGLLRAVLPDRDSPALFSWLSGLPFVETVGGGLHPHGAVRATLLADLTQREDTENDVVLSALTDELLRRVRDAAEPAALSAMADLAYVHRQSPAVSHLYAVDRRGRVEPERLEQDDVTWAIALARDVEGEESAAIVRYWCHRQPEAFALYRSVDNGEPVGFAARLVLSARRQEDVDADPVVAAAWRHCGRVEPVREGQHIAVRRFTVDGEDHRFPSAMTNLVSWQSLAAIARSSGLAYAFVVHPDPELWRTWMGATTDEVEDPPTVGGRRHAIFVNDWRYLTFAQYWEQAIGRPPVGGPAPVGPPLSRDDFDEAVRQALPLWIYSGGLTASPLGATSLAVASSGDVDAALRAAIREALDGMPSDQRGRRGHDAVVATYLRGSTTQQAAARRLGVPFSSYRRHLKQGVGDLCHRLWVAAGGTTRVG